MICLLQLCHCQFRSCSWCWRGVAYYRLGKNLFDSGILSRYSFSALTLQTMAVIPTRTAPKTAVLAFQFAGCAYQPPAGDQTCLGYLDSQKLHL
jgi:hypothetical protein